MRRVAKADGDELKCAMVGRMRKHFEWWHSDRGAAVGCKESSQGR